MPKLQADASLVLLADGAVIRKQRARGERDAADHEGNGRRIGGGASTVRRSAQR